MFISTFEIFKIGIGPSSSHTMGPMVAAVNFLSKIRKRDGVIPGAKSAKSVKCTLYGSLALTGKGHQTIRAIILGLSGLQPDSPRMAEANHIENEVKARGKVSPDGQTSLTFDPEKDILFDYRTDRFKHPNVLELQAFDSIGNLYMSERYYSIGGGFVTTEREFSNPKLEKTVKPIPFNFSNSEEMLQMVVSTGKNIAELMWANELIHRDGPEVETKLSKIWEVMNASIDVGLKGTGVLPGGLNVRRRANEIHQALLSEQFDNIIAPHVINDWISVYAIAVNEENASGGRIVTAPTNGAAGVIPAVIRYYLDHVPDAKKNQIPTFLLTASAIGGIIKSNASISGAEVGCQGEIGSAAAMAAAGLCSVLGGTPFQIENAAEIALEHHLGMTCDPIKGLVQAPCIERNGLGAIKAVSAASLALRGDGKHLVSLDSCIKTMKETGRDMSQKYKETALGGLAVNIADC